MSYFGCDCGALDCPDCGPAQGSKLIRVWSNARRRYVWVVDDGIDGPREEQEEPDYEVNHEA